MSKKIGMWGYVRMGTADGYGYAGYKIVEALKNNGVEVLWEETDAPLALQFCQPPAYEAAPEQYRIGYTPWESTEVPKDWAEHINKQDEFWTTANFLKDVYKDAGVTKDIKVVPHGIDNDWPFTARTGERPSDFIFLHQGEPAERKGSQIVFDAFRACFADKEDVHLVFKSNSWVECRWYDSTGSIIGPVDSFPNVHIITGILKLPELVDLYNKSHCMVYPSNGEGFGLIPFQAAATGLPTIAVPWGGVKDFEDFIIPVDYKVGPSQHGYHLGDWAWPDFDSVCEQMLMVYEDYKNQCELAALRAAVLHNNFQWNDIFEPIVADWDRFF